MSRSEGDSMPLAIRIQLGVLDTATVAALLDCEVSSVQSRAASGALPGLKIGRSWVFPMNALLAHLNEAALAEAAGRRKVGPPSAVAGTVPAPQRRGRRSVLPACLAGVVASS